MKKFLFALALIICSSTGFASGGDWGKTGHRATAEIAENNLTDKAKNAIDELLNGYGLAFVANYADDIKSDPDYRKYGPWHYVNIDPDAEEYVLEEASDRGDLVQAIRKCIAVLKDDNVSKSEKQFYLKMLVHFVGDLHQPFHTGHSEDKGGNDIQVRWFNDGSNIHRVWDSEMINFYQMSYTELAINTRTLTKKERKSIQSGKLLDWVYESRAMAEDLYAGVENGQKLGYSYMYEHMPTVLDQLQKGGLRLAKILNDIYAEKESES
ncbi:S1/P1 nuclease [Christiangramia sabulilitoris]|uniref:S1/P1 nuclease n=1 Tax=Christiangramia sabulilitoris TaxID=2583991 RepID=A0A550I318_9FLAO|nr:S1/P1 nuclease [Christiangramia sabulilitoris]TRO65384.1 S1/P1 nuclease [Christiangramia sabulilitoris]